MLLLLAFVATEAGAEELLPRLARVSVVGRTGMSARLEKGGGPRTWTLKVEGYPNDLYRQMLPQAAKARIEIRLVQRTARFVRVAIELGDSPRKLAMKVASAPPRILLDVGPADFLAEGVKDIDPPLVLFQVKLPSIEPIVPDQEYPRAPLKVTGAKSYNLARRLLREGELHEAIQAVQSYLKSHPEGQLVPYARYMYGEIQHRLARGPLSSETIRSSRLLKEALTKAPDLPMKTYARLLMARDLASAGLDMEAAEAFRVDGLKGARPAVEYAFRLGGAAVAANRGDDKKARDLLAPLWESQVPNEIGALTRLVHANLIYREGFCDRTLPMLQRAEDLDSQLGEKYPELLMMRAECLVKLKRFAKASPIYDALVRRDPPVDVLPMARTRQGDILYYSGDLEAARNDWLSVMGQFSAGAARELARIRLALHQRTRYDVAASLLDEARQLGGVGANDASYRLALLHFRNRKYDDAIKVADAVVSSKALVYVDHAKDLIERSIYQLFVEDFDKQDYARVAQRYLALKKEVAVHPAALRLHRAAARAFGKMELPDQRARTLQAALGRYEGTKGEQDLLLDLAEAYVAVEDGFRANRIVKYLETYVMKGSKSPRLAVARAEAAALSGQIGRAEKAFDRAVKYVRDDKSKVRLLARKGQVLHQAERFQKASKVFRKCLVFDRSELLVLDPHTALSNCSFGLGEALFELNSWTRAGKALAKAADRFPADRRAMVARTRAGLAFRQAHQLKKAMKQFNKARQAMELRDKPDDVAVRSGSIAPPTGESGNFWGRLAGLIGDDTEWDRKNADDYRLLMEVHE